MTKGAPFMRRSLARCSLRWKLGSKTGTNARLLPQCFHRGSPWKQHYGSEEKIIVMQEVIGALGGIRTPDPQI